MCLLDRHEIDSHHMEITLESQGLSEKLYVHIQLIPFIVVATILNILQNIILATSAPKMAAVGLRITRNTFCASRWMERDRKEDGASLAEPNAVSQNAHKVRMLTIIRITYLFQYKATRYRVQETVCWTEDQFMTAQTELTTFQLFLDVQFETKICFQISFLNLSTLNSS